jgi:hypothetical protein
MSLEYIKIRCVEMGECWEWASHLSTPERRANPEVRVGDYKGSARRYAYTQARGEIRPGWIVAPNCGNPDCINPAHQAQMSKGQRIRKAAKAGRLGGSKPKRTASVRSRAKLSLEIAREIRARPEPSKVLAPVYGVDKSVIKRIRNGTYWRDEANPFAGLFAANEPRRAA